MQISGLVKTSLIDYPGKITAVVFTQGCNFRCGFCHNPDLIEQRNGIVDKKDVWDFLDSRRGKLDGVVITGGEPVLQKNLENFIRRLKEQKFLVKLDTNGSNPRKLKKLLDDKLLDYVAMDIKGPLELYPRISKYLNTKLIQESIDILKKSQIDYEFRTTVLPYYHQIPDFEKVGKIINGAPLYTLQNFRPKITFEKKLQSERGFKKEELDQIAKIMRKYAKKVAIHYNID